MPNHELARGLIHSAGVPICAPSANKFGHVSPTKASHVADDFTRNNVLVLDGGQCGFGIESTVVKIEEQESRLLLKILRRGGVSEENLVAKINEFTESGVKVDIECV